MTKVSLKTCLTFNSSMYMECLSIHICNYKCFLTFEIVQEMIEDLTLAERIETLVPLSYIICFAIAYYGPNAEILGSVKMNLWQYKPVQDIGSYMTNLAMLFAVDFMSLIINGVVLKMTCNINMWKVLQKTQSEFWILIAVQQAYILNEVRNFITNCFKT